MNDLNDLNDMNEDEIISRIEIFYKSKTYTYIKNSYNDFFNGFIIKIEKQHIIFQDDKLGNIPIIIKEISEINYSRKNKNGVEK